MAFSFVALVVVCCLPYLGCLVFSLRRADSGFPSSNALFAIMALRESCRPEGDWTTQAVVFASQSDWSYASRRDPYLENVHFFGSGYASPHPRKESRVGRLSVPEGETGLIRRRLSSYWQHVPRLAKLARFNCIFGARGQVSRCRQKAVWRCRIKAMWSRLASSRGIIQRRCPAEQHVNRSWFSARPAN